MENENNNPDTQDNLQEILNYYKKNYNSKFCKEFLYEDFLEDDQKKNFIQFHKGCCCTKPLSLLIYSIFILIITCAGFYFSISKNKGYKAYKEILERNMSLVNTDVPNKHETEILMSYLSEEIIIDDYECNFLQFYEGFCSFNSYKQYCTLEKKNEGKCNYMDYQYNLGYEFHCTLQNYEAGLCNEIQFNYELERTEQIPIRHKIRYESKNAKIDIKNFIFENIWCKIGDYDQPIFLSFAIFIFLFIVLLIFDLIIKMKTILPGVKYYITISLYMIFNVIFKIYIVLFLILYLYGIYVCAFYPSTYTNPDNNEKARDPFSDKKVIIIYPEEQLWKDKRLYGLIFCGISFVLLILILILCCNKKLIYDYLSFNYYEKNNNSEPETKINRNASIKLRKNNYNFKIKQNKELYLKENRRKKKHVFKEIIFKNNNYYLKCDNYSIKDQLSWSDFKYPENNEITNKLSSILILIICILFFVIFLQIFNLDNDKNFEYFFHLIDLGYEQENKKYFEKSKNLNSDFKNYIILYCIIIGIISILTIVKWTFF